jgi:uncharacterized membrane protein
MDIDTRFYLAVLAMGLAAFACRIAGFVLMGWINITPRLEAALRAMPLAVMIGIVTPAVATGKPPEIAAVLVVGLIVKVTGNEVLAAVAGAAVVAAGRHLMR